MLDLKFILLAGFLNQHIKFRDTFSTSLFGSYGWCLLHCQHIPENLCAMLIEPLPNIIFSSSSLAAPTLAA
jgi:hypothetical protein